MVIHLVLNLTKKMKEKDLILERILLNMKYDSRKTLSENKEILKESITTNQTTEPPLTTGKKPGISVGPTLQGPTLVDDPNSTEVKKTFKTYQVPEISKLNKLTNTVDYLGKPIKFYGEVVTTIGDELRNPSVPNENDYNNFLADSKKNFRLDVYNQCMVNNNFDTYSVSSSGCVKKETENLLKNINLKSPYHIRIKNTNGVSDFYLSYSCGTYDFSNPNTTSKLKNKLCSSGGFFTGANYRNKDGELLGILSKDFIDPSTQIKKDKAKETEYKKQLTQINTKNNGKDLSLSNTSGKNKEWNKKDDTRPDGEKNSKESKGFGTEKGQGGEWTLELD